MVGDLIVALQRLDNTKTKIDEITHAERGGKQRRPGRGEEEEED